MRYLLSCCILALLCLNANAQKAWSLDECINFALDNNIDLQRQYNGVEMKRLQLETVSGSYIPKIEARVSPAFSTGMNMEVFVNSDFLYLPASINAYMPLVDLSISSNRESKEYATKASEARYRQTRQDVAIAVASYYMQALYAKKVLALSQWIEEADSETYDFINGRFSEGAVSENDLVRSSLALESSRKNTVQARSALEQAMIELRHFINAREISDVVEDAVSGLYTADVSADAANSAAVKAGEFDLLESKSALVSAKRCWVPSLSLQAGAGAFTYNELSKPGTMVYEKSFWGNRTAAVMLTLSIPIVDYAGRRADVKARTIQVRDKELALEKARNQYVRDEELLKSKIQAGGLSMERLSYVYECARKNYDSQRELYEGGYSSWTELQEAKKLYSQAGFEELNNRIRYQMDCITLNILLSRQQ